MMPPSMYFLSHSNPCCSLDFQWVCPPWRVRQCLLPHQGCQAPLLVSVLLASLQVHHSPRLQALVDPLPLGIDLYSIESALEPNCTFPVSNRPSEASLVEHSVMYGRRNPERRGESRASSFTGLFVHLQHVFPRVVNFERFVVVPFTNRPTAPSHIGCRLESAHIVGHRMYMFSEYPCKRPMDMFSPENSVKMG